jgi:hypothetical protein
MVEHSVTYGRDEEDGSERAGACGCAMGLSGDCATVFDVGEGRAEEPKAIERR